MAVVMKIGNAIVIHIDAETEIRTEAVNTEKEIVTVIVLRVKSVIVTEIGVTEIEDTVTVIKETEKDVRNVHREKIKIEKNQKNNEKKKRHSKTAGSETSGGPEEGELVSSKKKSRRTREAKEAKSENSEPREEGQRTPTP